MVYLALSMPDGAKERRLALQRAKEVQHLQAEEWEVIGINGLQPRSNGPPT